ncbi:MAG TPA: ABC transporter substrate-binding protein [Iamia sp.]|nr:ABC transporter substrate-binding protein [Iamia sp.]
MTRSPGTTTFAGRAGTALLALLLLVGITACGSRADDADDGGNGDDGLSAEEGGGDGDGGEEGGGGEVPTPDSDTIGDIDNPCSDDAGEGELPSDTPGVSEDTIRIGVISDKENPTVPLPTVGIEEAVKAFVEFCNAAGGINGRTLELLTYDSQITNTDEVTKQACNDDLFALVGSGSVQDQLGVESRVACELPEVAAYSATSTRAESDLFFQPIPATHSQDYNIGPCTWMAEQFPDAVKKAAIVYTDLPAARVRGEQIRDNCTENAGFEYLVDFPIPFGETNFGPLIAEMKSEGVEYFTMVSAASETLAVLREADTQGVEFEVIDLGQQYYDQAIADEALADGAYVLTNTVPFTETGETPALGLYTEWMDEIGEPEEKITTLGVQAFSAGLLFATAVDSLGNDLTRENLLTALEGITEWDGGGLQMPTNPGEDQLNDCFLYMRVVDGDFVREYPEEGFDCDPAYVLESDTVYEG